MTRRTRQTNPSSSAYEVLFRYTAYGRGIGIATFSEARLAFMRDGDLLLVAYGVPSAGRDTGFYADEWQSVNQLLYVDSPEDGTLGEEIESDYPGLLGVVEGVLRTGREVRFSLVGRKPIRIPERPARQSDMARLGALARAFLGVRGTDPYGNRVIVHTHPDDGSFTTACYVGSVVYESRTWAYEFAEWLESDAIGEDVGRVGVEALSSYEVGLIR